MSQQSVLDLAKQGNPSAIAALINRSLQPKGITARVSRKDCCLRITLEALTIPNQAGAIGWISNGIVRLKIAGIDTLQVFGQQQGDDAFAWSQTIALQKQQSVQEQQSVKLISQQPSNSREMNKKGSEDSTKLGLLKSAKEGDLCAISSLVSQSLKDEQVTVEAQMQFGVTLWLKLKAPTKLNQEACLQTVLKTLNLIKVDKIKSVRVTELSQTSKGKQLWNKYLSLKKGEFVDNTKAINQLA
jgi:hypothetical protein